MARGPDVVSELDKNSEYLSRTNTLDVVKCFGIGTVPEQTSNDSGTSQGMAESSSGVACLETGRRKTLVNRFYVVLLDCRGKLASWILNFAACKRCSTCHVKT